MSGKLVTSILAVLAAIGTASAQPGPYTTEVDFDRPGSDYDGFEQDGSWYGPEHCRDACEAKPRCRSFTYVRPGIDGPKARCRLKDAVPTPVESRCCVSGVKGGRPSQPAVPSTGLQLEWRGWTSDWRRHHLRLTVTPKTPQPLVSIALTTAEDPAALIDADAATRLMHREPDFRSQQSDALWVELDGRRLSPSPEGSLAQVSGPVTFDLFAEDRGQGWSRGTFVLVEVALGGDERARRWIRLAAPEGRLLGTWQRHCPNASPEAFEPMMLSGRLVIDLAADGKVTGRLGAIPFSGTLERSGSVSASGASGPATVTLQGTISKAQAQKAARGSGSFEVKGDPPCSGSGMWSSE